MGRDLFSSAIINPALVTELSASGSTSVMVPANSAIACPNGTICSAKSARELVPPPKKDAIPFTISAAVRVRIIFARFPTESMIKGSTEEAPSRNGCKFSIKVDKSVAISGSAEVIPDAIPPIMPPTSPPMPCPTASKISTPLSTNSSSCGK